jgi:hypothetical protein
MTSARLDRRVNDVARVSCLRRLLAPAHDHVDNIDAARAAKNHIVDLIMHTASPGAA